MYPVVPMLARTVTNSFEFAGYRIEAGESVMVATSVPHYLPECFPGPDRFDIERYAEGRAEHRQPYAYAPFGLGPHRCLGNGFAEVQINVTMATLLHDVELALHPSGYRLRFPFRGRAIPSASARAPGTPTDTDSVQPRRSALPAAALEMNTPRRDDRLEIPLHRLGRRDGPAQVPKVLEVNRPGIPGLAIPIVNSGACALCRRRASAAIGH